MQRKNPIISRGAMFSKLTRKNWSQSTEDRILNLFRPYTRNGVAAEAEALADKLIEMLDKADSEELMNRMLDKANL